MPWLPGRLLQGPGLCRPSATAEVLQQVRAQEREWAGRQDPRIPRRRVSVRRVAGDVRPAHGDRDIRVRGLPHRSQRGADWGPLRGQVQVDIVFVCVKTLYHSTLQK